MTVFLFGVDASLFGVCFREAKRNATVFIWGGGSPALKQTHP